MVCEPEIHYNESSTNVKHGLYFSEVPVTNEIKYVSLFIYSLKHILRWMNIEFRDWTTL